MIHFADVAVSTEGVTFGWSAEAGKFFCKTGEALRLMRDGDVARIAALSPAMKPRILVIDDDEDICDLVQQVLERTERFTVQVETHPALARAAAKLFLPDLILLDVNMPAKSGLTVAREFAQDATLANRPILFLTGFVDPSEAGFVVREGQHYLAKTAGSDALIEAVDRILAPPA